MSIVAMEWAWRQRVGNPTRKSILLALADHADSDGICWPGHEGISGRVEVSRRTVMRQIERLEADGFLRVERRRDQGGKQTTNLYLLRVSDCHPDRVTNETEPGDTHDQSRVTQVSHEPSVEPSVEPKASSPAAENVFAYWQRRLGKHRARLTPGRREKIRARLRDGTTVEEMIQAVDGCAGSDFHRLNGHTDLTLILRSREKVEQFMDLAGAGSSRDAEGGFFGEGAV